MTNWLFYGWVLGVVTVLGLKSVSHLVKGMLAKESNNG